MLGQEQRESEFVAASRFSTEKERARGRAGFLFGDEDGEGGKESSPSRKGKQEAKQEEEGNEDPIDMITIEKSDEATLVTRATQ